MSAYERQIRATEQFYDRLILAAEAEDVEVLSSVVPGSRLSSTLYLVVAGKTAPEIRMPPHHDESWAEGRGAALSARQIEMIGAWIDQGAKDN